MLITDRLTIIDKRRTADGYLVTTARFARSGIYEYSGKEVGKPAMDKVRVWRPDDEVFSEDAMASFAHRPITNDHPFDGVDAHNWKREAIGFSDGRVARDGDFVIVPMMVTDAAAIEDVEAGKVELSAGYACDLEFVDGATSEGQNYDAIMRNIRGNHIALVDRGRAGSECRIGDQFGEKTMDLKKITVDGFEVETTQAGVTAIATLQGKLADADKALSDATAAHATALADKDKELATKDGEIEKLKGQVVDAPALDKRVADRAVLVSNAQRIVPNFDASGKSDADIKRAIVQDKCGEQAVKDKSDAYVEARFDTLVEGIGDSGTDHVREAVLNGPTFNPQDAAKAEADALAEANDVNAWRTQKKA